MHHNENIWTNENNETNNVAEDELTILVGKIKNASITIEDLVRLQFLFETPGKYTIPDFIKQIFDSLREKDREEKIDFLRTLVLKLLNFVERNKVNEALKKSSTEKMSVRVRNAVIEHLLGNKSLAKYFMLKEIELIMGDNIDLSAIAEVRNIKLYYEYVIEPLIKDKYIGPIDDLKIIIGDHFYKNIWKCFYNRKGVNKSEDDIKLESWMNSEPGSEAYTNYTERCKLIANQLLTGKAPILATTQENDEIQTPKPELDEYSNNFTHEEKLAIERIRNANQIHFISKDTKPESIPQKTDIVTFIDLKDVPKHSDFKTIGKIQFYKSNRSISRLLERYTELYNAATDESTQTLIMYSLLNNPTMRKPVTGSISSISNKEIESIFGFRTNNFRKDKASIVNLAVSKLNNMVKSNKKDDAFIINQFIPQIKNMNATLNIWSHIMKEINHPSLNIAWYELDSHIMRLLQNQEKKGLDICIMLNNILMQNGINLSLLQNNYSEMIYLSNLTQDKMVKLLQDLELVLKIGLSKSSVVLNVDSNRSTEIYKLGFDLKSLNNHRHFTFMPSQLRSDTKTFELFRNMHSAILKTTVEPEMEKILNDWKDIMNGSSDLTLRFVWNKIDSHIRDLIHQQAEKAEVICKELKIILDHPTVKQKHDACKKAELIISKLNYSTTLDIEKLNQHRHLTFLPKGPRSDTKTVRLLKELNTYLKLKSTKAPILKL